MFSDFLRYSPPRASVKNTVSIRKEKYADNFQSSQPLPLEARAAPGARAEAPEAQRGGGALARGRGREELGARGEVRGAPALRGAGARGPRRGAAARCGGSRVVVFPCAVVGHKMPVNTAKNTIKIVRTVRKRYCGSESCDSNLNRSGI